MAVVREAPEFRVDRLARYAGGRFPRSSQQIGAHSLYLAAATTQKSLRCAVPVLAMSGVAVERANWFSTEAVPRGADTTDRSRSAVMNAAPGLKMRLPGIGMGPGVASIRIP